MLLLRQEVIETREIDKLRSVDSEAAIVATLLHHPEFIHYSERLNANHFTDDNNACIYGAMQELSQSGVENFDTFNIMKILSEDRYRRRAGSITIEDLHDFEANSLAIVRDTPEEYNMFVDAVLDAAMRRDIYIGLEECQRMVLSDRDMDIVQGIYRTIDDAIDPYSRFEDIPPYADVVDELWAEIESRQGDGYAGIPFKFPDLNEYVTIEKGELVIFGAQQKVGKSIMLLNCAVDLLRKDYSVLYIDSELSSRLFTARLLSHLSGVKYRTLTAGGCTDEENAEIMRQKEWMKSRKFYHIYMPFFDQQSLFTTVKRIHHIQPLDVIIIDYFKSTGNDMDAFQTYASMGRCVDMVKNDICGSMGIAGIGAAQATVNNRLADSAKIARNASTVIMLVDKTPEEIEADGEECGNKKMVVTINRNGMQHSPGEYIDVHFDGDHILYEEAKQHIPQTPF